MRIADDRWAVIRRELPIACVDLVVSDRVGRVLMLDRRRFPRGWWFPGGRVLLREPRAEAAVEEWSTHDVIFPGDVPDEGVPHAITTLFGVCAAPGPVIVDEQSGGFEWRTPVEWLGFTEHPLLRAGLARALERVG